jgi:hypothetical protein
MKNDNRLSTIRVLMAEFAARSGLDPVAKEPRRYLWTDAFAVCNFLELYRRTNEEKFRDLALRLVDQVHAILGRHRDDDPRSGWLSGLGAEEGRRHPTIGGLRIGKELNERGPGEPFDERLEWERDGQYYHYLTKWMHALNRLSRATGEAAYNVWALELAKTAHAGFTSLPHRGGRKRMVWKMSIDLGRPLVPSMGQHDPLDGLVTFSQLQATARCEFAGTAAPRLDAEILDLAQLCIGRSLATDDPLGIGGLLFDACRMAQLRCLEAFEPAELLADVLGAARLGLESFAVGNPLRLPAEYRLAFRELGLSIGLQGIEKIRRLIGQHPGAFAPSVLPLVEELERYAPLGETIEGFWAEGRNRNGAGWTGNREINSVMLATSLAPAGFLTI